MISLKIDVSLLDKTRFFRSQKPAKDGHLPIYADIILVPSREGKDQYGNDGFVAQSASKEEKAAGLKLPILGNYKTIGAAAPSSQQQRPPRQESQSDGW